MRSKIAPRLGIIPLLVLVLTVIFLDWLALDDITTGQESSFLGEYLILFASVPILIILGYLLFHSTDVLE